MSKYATIHNTKVSVGDTIRVAQKIDEGGKTRAQVFEGAVIAISGRGTGQTFTVRKIAAGGIGVERIFPVHSPMIESVSLKQAGKVNRAKLFYLRDRVGKAATSIKKRIVTNE
ncbi:50S ribosomal protein L19 [Candidatus Woesebacteria bacterium]|nr:50S ribosomal protein L19 [Candidatus Woesebacteria bacterium]MCD8507516.1 50S ribosomal protein L19 [Candidatus Woesebacteria bacterium]MCD8527329.1 50S ribosomal protein L19 [Candidatus Woesebacteria bacterium]MCD8545747.1 50S ribosomal protein L19 [Candidatus Woesebacteria bacterium]